MPGVTFEELMNPSAELSSSAWYAPKLIQVYEDAKDLVEEKREVTIIKVGQQQGAPSAHSSSSTSSKRKQYWKRQPYTFMETVNSLKRWCNMTLDEIVRNRGPIDTFIIGKTFARKKKNAHFDPMNFNTWKLAGGVNGRWGHYKREGFHGMVVLCAVTRDLLPLKDSSKPQGDSGDDSDPDERNNLFNQQDYVLSLEQQLIHYYAYAEQDSRLGNISVKTGNDERQNATAAVLYIAFKLETEE